MFLVETQRRIVFSLRKHKENCFWLCVPKISFVLCEIEQKAQKNKNMKPQKIDQ
jgi:hypothetical protein